MRGKKNPKHFCQINSDKFCINIHSFTKVDLKISSRNLNILTKCTTWSTEKTNNERVAKIDYKIKFSRNHEVRTISKCNLFLRYCHTVLSLRVYLLFIQSQGCIQNLV